MNIRNLFLNFYFELKFYSINLLYSIQNYIIINKKYLNCIYPLN